MKNRNRIIWNIIGGLGTLLGILDFCITHLNFKNNNMLQFILNNSLSFIGIVGFLLLVGLNIYWKINDYIDFLKNEIYILKQIVNNHAIKISEQERHGIKRVDIITYYDAQLLEQNTPIKLNVLYFPNNDIYSKYIEGKASQNELDNNQ